jgi:hypothetical protein
MPSYWKFKFKGSRFVHLSKRRKGAMGAGDVTLCGLRIGPLWGSATPTTQLNGTECERCLAEIFGRSRWVMVPGGLRSSRTCDQ